MELGPSRKMLPIIARMMGYVPASAGDLRKQFGSGSIQFLRGVSHHVNDFSGVTVNLRTWSNYKPWHPEPKSRYVNV